jgi:hypothetical protein
VNSVVEVYIWGGNDMSVSQKSEPRLEGCARRMVVICQSNRSGASHLILLYDFSRTVR